MLHSTDPDIGLSRSSDRARLTEWRIAAYLNQLGITQDARSFVKTVSNIYHEHEAQLYDAKHLEVQEISGYWQACLKSIEPYLPSSIDVLDIGAGTGFASEQVLKVLGGQVSRLACLDLSLDMLMKCRQRLHGLTERADFICGEPECISGRAENFDLVITNSFLHHLIDLPNLFDVTRRILKPGGFYVTGHEPSSEFYSNQEVYRWTKIYRKWRRLRRLVFLSNAWSRVTIKPAIRDMEQLTNESLLRKGIIESPLPPGVVRQLVDIHVPPESPDAPFWGEYGFSAADLRRKYLSDFELCYLITYPHIKDARTRMGRVWRAIDRMLAEKYPTAGANFLMATRRGTNHSPE